MNKQIDDINSKMLLLPNPTKLELQLAELQDEHRSVKDKIAAFESESSNLPGTVDDDSYELQNRLQQRVLTLTAEIEETRTRLTTISPENEARYARLQQEQQRHQNMKDIIEELDMRNMGDALGTLVNILYEPPSSVGSNTMTGSYSTTLTTSASQATQGGSTIVQQQIPLSGQDDEDNDLLASSDDGAGVMRYNN